MSPREKYNLNLIYNDKAAMIFFGQTYKFQVEFQISIVSEDNRFDCQSDKFLIYWMNKSRPVSTGTDTDYTWCLCG